jgi:hypothetical protein
VTLLGKIALAGDSEWTSLGFLINSSGNLPTQGGGN